MSWIKSLIIASFILLASLMSVVHCQMDVTGNLKPVIFAQTMPVCRMFAPSCDIDLLVSKKIPAGDWAVVVADTQVLTFDRIISCDEEKCSMERFGLNDTRLRDEYNAYSLKIIPDLIGGTELTIISNSLTNEPMETLYKVLIKQPRRIIDMIFDFWIYVIGTFISLLMGILLDRSSLVKIIKMPKAIAVGFCCQYLTMPLLAFAVARIFKLTPLESLALFVYGCCPGGIGSNNWTILFDGDLDLSAILTFVSTCSSMIMMPAWVYSLGKVLSKEAQISIPIVGLLGNLLITVGPCLIGLLISYLFPKIKKATLKIAKPFTLLVMLSFLIISFMAKFYLFKLVRLRHWYSSPIVPFTGYVLGGSISFLLGLPARQVKTVAIETGIQNIGIGFLIVYTNFPSPEADYAAFPLFTVAFLTTLPLYLTLLVTRIFKCLKSKKNDEATINEKIVVDNNSSFLTNNNTTADTTIEKEPMIINSTFYTKDIDNFRCFSNEPSSV